MKLRSYRPEDARQAMEIWNDIVVEGKSFPGDQPLDETGMNRLAAAQTDTVVAEEEGEILGIYILHPNNAGRCGHVANASYGVKRGCRGRGLGRRLVEHSLQNAKAHGFRGLQFNAVVAENRTAIALYEDLGFVRLGTVPGGYHMADGRYVDTYIYYYSLTEPYGG